MRRGTDYATEKLQPIRNESELVLLLRSMLDRMASVSEQHRKLGQELVEETVTLRAALAAALAAAAPSAGAESQQSNVQKMHIARAAGTEGATP